MRKKLLIMSFLTIILLSPIFAQGATKTETIVEKSNLLFEWGYINYFTEKTPENDTEVSVVVVSDQPLLFFVCDEGDVIDYANGSEIYAYVIYENVTYDTLTFTLEDKQEYDFAFDNFNVNELDATVSVTITFTYETQATWYIWLIILGVAGGLIALIIYKNNKSKSQRHQYAQYPQYSQYPQKSYPQSYEQSQSPTDKSAPFNRYCTECGAPNEENSSFCTNCGNKMS